MFSISSICEDNVGLVVGRADKVPVGTGGMISIIKLGSQRVSRPRAMVVLEIDVERALVGF